MPLFQPVDHGTKYFFDFQADSLKEWMPLFQAGYYAGSLPVAGGLVLVLGAFWFWKGRPRRAIAILTTLLAGAAFVLALRLLIDRLQPDKAHLFLTLDGLYPSFPSLSVFLATLTATFAVLTVAALTPRRLPNYAAFLVAALFVIGVLVSQLLLRLHYLSDLLAGLSAGCGFAFLGWHLGDAFEASSFTSPAGSPTALGDNDNRR